MKEAMVFQIISGNLSASWQNEAVKEEERQAQATNEISILRDATHRSLFLET